MKLLGYLLPLTPKEARKKQKFSRYPKSRVRVSSTKTIELWRYLFPARMFFSSDSKLYKIFLLWNKLPKYELFVRTQKTFNGSTMTTSTGASFMCSIRNFFAGTNFPSRSINCRLCSKSPRQYFSVQFS